MNNTNSIFEAMAKRRNAKALEESVKATEAQVTEDVVEEEIAEVVEEAADTNEMDAEVVEAMKAEGIEVTEENYNAVIDAYNAMIEEEAEAEDAEAEESEEANEEAEAEDAEVEEAKKEACPECGKEPCQCAKDEKKANCSEKCKNEELEDMIRGIVEEVLASKSAIEEQGGGANIGTAPADNKAERFDGQGEDKAPTTGSAAPADKTPAKAAPTENGDGWKSNKADTKNDARATKVAEEEDSEEAEVSEEADDIAELQCRLEECGGSQFMFNMLADGRVDMVKRYLEIKEA